MATFTSKLSDIGFDHDFKTLNLHLPAPLFSLRIFELRYMVFMVSGVFCSLFPNVTDLILSDVKMYDFPDSLALHNCGVLNSLDLSGSAQKFKTLDPKYKNHSIPSLKTLVLARNELESLGQVLAIKAPNLNKLNLSDNNIKTIDISVENTFRNLYYLFIDGNDLISVWS